MLFECCGIGRAKGKDISGMGSRLHDGNIGRIAIKAWFQFFSKGTADNLFLAVKDEAIAGPIVRINMRIDMMFLTLLMVCFLLLDINYDSNETS